ncbi:hypothetical protein Q8F55_001558 [Vanrija albida]|uniref:AB hydrolase-1 domain-containing protein n=1 Tax=Vanrija albida TaxID=181172 RepID=A0ABR3QHC2_9TREE
MTSPTPPTSPFLSNTSTVAVPGRTLTVYTAGPAASPDVILLESGLGQGAAYWGGVVEAITAAAPELRVVGYDRAGYGVSSPPTDSRTLHDLAADLGAVVDSLGASRLVLVAHSWGGPIVRTYAASAPSPHGIVLVDHSDEGCAAYFWRSMGWAFWLQAWLYTPLSYLGVLRYAMRRMGDGIPEPYFSAALASSTSPTAARAGALEVSHVQSDLRGLLDNPPAIGDTPLVVISAADTAANTPGSMRELLIAAHKRTAAAAKNGTFVVAEKSGHIVPASEPGLIAGHAVGLFRGRPNAE